MASIVHETLVALFRDRPQLIFELLREHHIDIQEDATYSIEDAELTELSPKHYRADLVIVTKTDGKVALVIVLEMQLQIDNVKLKSWPSYLVNAHVRWSADTCVVVVCPDKAVARWAAQPIHLGPGSLITPVVMGPNEIPFVTDQKLALENPELAIVSAIAHGGSENALDVVINGLLAASKVDEERGTIYADLILARVSPAMRQAVEEMMVANKYEYQSDFARKYYGQGLTEGKAEGVAEGIAKGKAEGVAEGEAKALLTILEVRGLTLTEEQQHKVTNTTDLAQLNRWLKLAVVAKTTDELFAEF
ncbi:MAG: hypothetical protein HUU55_12655 [Myxococcales bacterium]|nr:hypothetical protein [Myxococcales bacterium]